MSKAENRAGASRLTRITVVRSVRDPRKGFLKAGAAVFPCALGRSGIKIDKREGDGGTPRAKLPLRRLFFRSDRLPRPASLLPARRIGPRDAWCDDMADRRYNRLMAADGFGGIDGIFRFNDRGIAVRALEVSEIGAGGFRVVDPAPTKW